MVFYSKVNLIKIINTYNKSHIEKIKKINKLQMFKELKCKLSGCKFPLKRGEWLSSIDIDYIMTKYELKYPSFNFLGTFPIDFNKLYPEIYNLNKNKLKNKLVGVIFNTASSKSNGEHWISLFINDIEKTICFFDSNGNYPPLQVKKFIDNINKNNIYSVFINNSKKQFKDGTCGIFAINFIVERLSKKSCKEIFNENLNDEMMENLRCKLFK